MRMTIREVPICGGLEGESHRSWTEEDGFETSSCLKNQNSSLREQHRLTRQERGALRLAMGLPVLGGTETGAVTETERHTGTATRLPMLGADTPPTR